MAKQSMHIAFVTGTRAEYGLMQTTLAAIHRTRSLKLSVIATGMHTHKRFASGSLVPADVVVPWKHAASRAQAMGHATASLAKVFVERSIDLVMVVGDRVEALAAACAAVPDDRLLLHLHGGDRAMGQADDSIRHAITKLAHLHVPATQRSAARLLRLGEDRDRILHIGTPGLDGITRHATRRTRRGVVVIALHPMQADDVAEAAHASQILQDVSAAAPGRTIIVIDPNNDPGSAGIRAAWSAAQKDGTIERHANLARADFLGLLRDADVLVGNSSAGVIESDAFGTPVVDVGPRQCGRERGGNVCHVATPGAALRLAIAQRLRHGRFSAGSVYRGNAFGIILAKRLASVRPTPMLLRKVIAY